MASLRELKTKWQIRYYDARRDPNRTTDSIDKAEYTESEAESEAEYRQQLYDRGRYDPWTQAKPGAAARAGHDLTLQELAKLYVEEKQEAGRRGEAGGWTEKTYKSDAPILKDFARKTGPGLQASRLRTSHIRSWVYQEHLANATKRGYHRRVRAMLRWAERKDLVPDMPAGEIQIGDAEWRQKSGQEDVIPLLPPGQFYARQFFKGYAWGKGRTRNPDDRLFGAGPGARRPSSSFKRAVREAAKDESSTINEARAERISMYTLRHSCATHWLREGKSLIWVNRLLRHSQVQTTMEYVHIAGVDLQNMD